MTTQIIEFDEFESKMIEFRAHYWNVVYDMTDILQEKQAKADRYAIGKVIRLLDSRHKEIKAPLAKQVSLIDGERKRIKDELLRIQNKIKSQIEAHAKKIAEHDKMLQAKVDDILVYANIDNFISESSCVLNQVLNSLKSIVVDDSFEDRKEEALQAQEQTIAKISSLYNSKVIAEKQQEELEILRKEKEEREIEDRKKAFEKEQAEKHRKQLEEETENLRRQAEIFKENELILIEKAENAKKKAVEIALQQERERVEEEQRVVERRTEEEHQLDEDRKTHIEYKNQVRDEAIDSLEEYFYEREYSELKEIGEDILAESIIDQIIEGKIKNVTILY